MANNTNHQVSAAQLDDNATGGHRFYTSKSWTTALIDFFMGLINEVIGAISFPGISKPSSSTIRSGNNINGTKGSLALLSYAIRDAKQQQRTASLKYEKKDGDEEKSILCTNNADVCTKKLAATKQINSPSRGIISTQENSNPTMLKEIHQTMALSMLMYQLVELRHKVDAGELELPQDTKISLPRTAGQLLRAGKVAFTTAPSSTSSECEIKDKASSSQRQIKSMRHLTDEHHEEHLKTMVTVMNEMDGFQLDILKRTEVLNLSDDENAVKHARVYAISLDHVMKRIIVSFRGSSSIYDWMHNLQLDLATIPNPFYRPDEHELEEPSDSIAFSKSPKNIRLHSGFYKAMNCDKGDACEASKVLDDKFSKAPMDYETIVQTIKDLGLLSKGYKLYVTGHSLGGALATLFGYFAATDDDLVTNGPVTIYSYASPRVGDYQFQQSFVSLERSGRLIHARIRNHLDKVTLVPYVMGTYKHVGLMVNLKGDKSSGLMPALDYPKTRSWLQESPTFLKNILTLNNTLTYHSTEEIFRRIKSWKDFFAELKLEDQYKYMLTKTEGSAE